jgi:hypothetical protein
METRYAVIIGINDYDNQPLSFCVNDAHSIKNVLRDKANFYEKNIYSITSETEYSLKDITGKLYETISKIKNTFQEESDSLFFYFAGHGIQEDNESFLVFHDSKHKISSIYNAFYELKPKMQFYVIDACESGNKTLKRSVFYEKDNYLNDLVKNSSGILFLYACQADQVALESENIKHGIMTHHFIEAIQNEKLYDEDGILTPGRIQEYVAKKVATFSHFTQIPVSESNTRGYYPFAMRIPAFENVSLIPVITSPQNRVVSFIKPDRESRLKLQKISIDFLTDAITSFVNANFGDYQKFFYDNANAIQLSNKNVLIEKIVSDAEEKYRAINKTIYFKEKPIYAPDSRYSIAGLFGYSYERKIERYDNIPIIEYANEFYSSIDVILIHDDIRKVSFGIGGITYQAKWGGVISPYFYKIEWDGEKNSIITNIEKYHYTYLVEPTSLEEIPKITFKMFPDIQAAVAKWNTWRKEELESFKINPSKKDE